MFYNITLDLSIELFILNHERLLYMKDAYQNQIIYKMPKKTKNTDTKISIITTSYFVQFY